MRVCCCRLDHIENKINAYIGCGKKMRIGESVVMAAGKHMKGNSCRGYRETTLGLAKAGYLRRMGDKAIAKRLDCIHGEANS